MIETDLELSPAEATRLIADLAEAVQLAIESDVYDDGLYSGTIYLSVGRTVVVRSQADVRHSSRENARVRLEAKQRAVFAEQRRRLAAIGEEWRCESR